MSHWMSGPFGRQPRLCTRCESTRMLARLIHAAKGTCWIASSSGTDSAGPKPSSRLMALPTVRGVASPPATFTTLPAGPRSITSAYASPKSSMCTFGVAAAIGVHRSFILRGKGNEATEDRSLAVAVDERGSYHDAAGIDYLELEGTSPSHRWRCRRLVIVASRTDAVADDTESACIDETPAGGCRRAEHRRSGALLHGHRGVETIVRVASKCGVDHHIGHRDPPLQPSAIGEVAGERLDALLA
jgi:hypothetical protein